jgi:hypothetical protein
MLRKRRLEALMGSDEKDTATGNCIGVGEAALIRAQKATIAKQLILSKSIVNGMSRIMNVLEIMGILGTQ